MSRYCGGARSPLLRTSFTGSLIGLSVSWRLGAGLMRRFPLYILFLLHTLLPLPYYMTQSFDIP